MVHTKYIKTRIRAERRAGRRVPEHRRNTIRKVRVHNGEKRKRYIHDHDPSDAAKLTTNETVKNVRTGREYVLPREEEKQTYVLFELPT